MSREEFQNKLANVIKPPESGAAGYNAFVFSGDASKGSIRPPKKLTEMTGEEVLEYQARLKASTKAAGQGKINGVAYGTSAVGAYQIVRQNLTNEDKTGYYDKNPGEKDKLFNEEQQDKIYRSLISGAVDEYMRTGDKAKFEEYVVKTWEAFKPEGSDARKQLQALLNNPAFTEGAGDSSKKQTKEQRAARTKIATQMFDDSLKKIMMPSDTTIATIGGNSVVEMATNKVKEVADSVDLSIRSLFDSGKGVKDMFKPGMGLESIFGPPPKNDAPVIINNNDNKQTNIQASGGGSQPSHTNNVISKMPYDRNSHFNSLAGGLLQI
jgi:hypothetical protein